MQPNFNFLANVLVFPDNPSSSGYSTFSEVPFLAKPPQCDAAKSMLHSLWQSHITYSHTAWRCHSPLSCCHVSYKPFTSVVETCATKDTWCLLMWIALECEQTLCSVCLVLPMDDLKLVALVARIWNIFGSQGKLTWKWMDDSVTDDDETINSS